MSSDGKRVAFVTWVDGRNVAVVNGEVGESFDAVSWPLAISAGGVVAYSAREGDRQYVLRDANKSRPYRWVSNPVLSADGNHIAYAASDGRGWFAVREGVEGPKYGWVGNVVLDRSGRMAYVAEDRGAAFLVYDGKPGPAFDRVTRPAFLANGQPVYGALKEKEWFLVVGDRAASAEGPISSVFAGSRAGYVVERPDGYAVVADRRGTTFEWVGWPTFASDGRVVYLAARGKTKFLAVGERTIELGEWVVWDPVISPDGTRIGFGAKIGRELWWKVLPLAGP